MTFELNKEGRGVNRKRVQRRMRVMGIEALVPRPGTSKAAPGHKIYPYLSSRHKSGSDAPRPLGQFRNRRILAQRLKRNLRLERRIKLLA